VTQGAAQAIEDAGVLTCALSLTKDILAALGVYEKGTGPKFFESSSIIQRPT
jgi:hypothetical protein